MSKYTADILFYLAIFLGLLLFIFSAITWDNYRDYQYRVMDADKAKRARTLSGILFVLAILAVGASVILYYWYPPEKIVTRTVFSKPETKNINVYTAPSPSDRHTMRSTQVRAAPRPKPLPSSQCPPPRRQVILLEESGVQPPCPPSSSRCPPCPPNGISPSMYPDLSRDIRR